MQTVGVVWRGAEGNQTPITRMGSGGSVALRSTLHHLNRNLDRVASEVNRLLEAGVFTKLCFMYVQRTECDSVLIEIHGAWSWEQSLLHAQGILNGRNALSLFESSLQCLVVENKLLGCIFVLIFKSLAFWNLLSKLKISIIHNEWLGKTYFRYWHCRQVPSTSDPVRIKMLSERFVNLVWCGFTAGAGLAHLDTAGKTQEVPFVVPFLLASMTSC